MKCFRKAVSYTASEEKNETFLSGRSGNEVSKHFKERLLMRKAKTAAKVENPTPTKEELEAQQLAALDKTIETVKWRWKKPVWE